MASDDPAVRHDDADDRNHNHASNGAAIGDDDGDGGDGGDGDGDNAPSPPSTPRVISMLNFIRCFVRSRGGVPILLMSLTFSFGVGATVGLVPDTTADRYARVRFGWNGTQACGDYDRVAKPQACQDGSDAAQAANAWSNMVSSSLSVLFNPVLGRISDVVGRRYIMIATVTAACVPAAMFWILLRVASMDPVWYFVSKVVGGIIISNGATFAALSDIMPAEYRAVSFGVVMASFYGGFSLAPSIPLVLDSVHVAAVAVMLGLAASLIGFLFLPETLPEHIRLENVAQLQQQRRREQQEEDDDEYEAQHLLHGSSSSSRISHRVRRMVGAVSRVLTRPFRDMSILNRCWTIRLLAAGSLFSGMVFASDVVLVIYYIEDQLNVHENDIALMFLVMGVFGILTQAGLLHPLVSLLGEKRLLVATFVCGTLHNLLYGAAKGKSCIYVALALSQLTKLNVALLSSLASQTVSDHEQGQVQGALFAVNAIAAAVGPLLLEYVYAHTKDTVRPGPGFMFLVAAGLYGVGTIFVSFIPAAKSRRRNVDGGIPHGDDGESPGPRHLLMFDVEEQSNASLRTSMGTPLLQDHTVE